MDDIADGWSVGVSVPTPTQPSTLKLLEFSQWTADGIQLYLSGIAERHRHLELVWRAHQLALPAAPLLSLRTKGANMPIGTCETVVVGTIEAGSNPISIVSACAPLFTNGTAATVLAAFGSNKTKPFQWTSKMPADVRLENLDRIVVRLFDGSNVDDLNRAQKYLVTYNFSHLPAVTSAVIPIEESVEPLVPQTGPTEWRVWLSPERFWALIILTVLGLVMAAITKERGRRWKARVLRLFLRQEEPPVERPPSIHTVTSAGQIVADSVPPFGGQSVTMSGDQGVAEAGLRKQLRVWETKQETLLEDFRQRLQRFERAGESSKSGDQLARVLDRLVTAEAKAAEVHQALFGDVSLGALAPGASMAFVASDERPQLTAHHRAVVEAMLDLTELAHWLQVFLIRGTGNNVLDRLSPGLRLLAVGGTPESAHKLVADPLSTLRELSQHRQALSWWLGRSPLWTPGLRSIIADWRSAVEASPARFVSEWASIHLPKVQTIIEAWPREIDVSTAEGTLDDAFRGVCSSMTLGVSLDQPSVTRATIADAFHDRVAHVYAAVGGARYYPVRLYQDSLETEGVRQLSKSIFAAASSRLLVEKGLVRRHGVVVRVLAPVVRFDDRSQLPLGYRFDGSVEYAEVISDEKA